MFASRYRKIHPAASLLLGTLLSLGCSNVPFLKHEISESGVFSKFAFNEYYALNVEVYSITSGAWGVPAGQASSDEAALQKMFTGWSSTSVNTVLSQAGIWIKRADIKFVADDKADLDIYDAGGAKNIVTGTVGRHFDFVLADGSTHRSPARSERIVIGKQGGGASWATLGEVNVFFQHNHGRNIMAHELGHNFALRHANGASGCETANTDGRVMNGTIYPDDYNFASCEIKIARETMNRWLRDYPAVVRVERPPGADLKKAIGFFEGEDFARRNLAFSNRPADIIAAPILMGDSAAAGYSSEDAEGAASLARTAHRCSVHTQRAR